MSGGMRTDRRDFDGDVNDLWHFAGIYLPEGWELRVAIVRGETSLSLYNPDGMTRNVDDYGDADFISIIVMHVNYARKSEGFGPVEWGGLR